MSYPNYAARVTSHLTVKPSTSPDDHGPVKPPPIKAPYVEDLVQDSESHKKDIDSNCESNTNHSRV